MFRFALFALLFYAPLAFSAPVPKALKKKPVLDGKWEVVEWYSRGNKINNSMVTTWTIEGEDLTIERTNARGGLAARSTVTYKLSRPAKESDNALDYQLVYSTGRVVTYPGTCEIDGDTLKFAYAPSAGPTSVRPADASSSETNVAYVFKRSEK